MRLKREAVLSFESSDDGLPKVVREYRRRYRAISQVLDDNDTMLSAVHEDLKQLSEGGSEGRSGDYTSENIFRALIVQHCEGLPFRDTVIRIGSDPFLQDFLRMRKKVVMDFTFLDKCFLAIQPETWKRVNEVLGQYGVAQETVSTDVIRTDTTVVESNIHYPTDVSLLWDAWRVASRLLTRARDIDPASCPHRFHTLKIKRHKKLFGNTPEVLAADKGFCPDAEKYAELEQQVGTLAIPRRMQDFADKVLAHWQAFRAGIEGTISGLKRAFRLVRCYFKQYKGFSSAVGLGVLCHNLIILAEHKPG